MTCDSKSEKLASDENEIEFSEVTTETGTEDEEYSDSADSFNQANMYHGTQVKPLSQFGTFEIKPEIRALKWISDHTSGKTHPDMPVISMLYNQDLCLPRTAKLFVAQSRELREEARWEKLKAVFYSFYPANIQSRIHETLSGLSVVEASRVIAKKTSRFELEVLLRPLEVDSCNEDDLIMLEKAIPEAISKVIERISRNAEALKDAERRLLSYTEYSPTLVEDLDLRNRRDALHATVKRESEAWVKNLEDCQIYARKGHETCLWLFQLEHLTCRLDPRTLWIHLKTQPLLCASTKDKRIPEVLHKRPMPDEYCLKGGAEQRHRAMRNQIEQLEIALRELDIPFLQNFDLLHNHNNFEQFELCVSYANYSPKVCSTILQTRVIDSFVVDRCFIMSKPVISTVPKSHHSMRVYLDMSKVREPDKYNYFLNSTLERFKPYGFCFNCFSKDHTTNKCPETKREFGIQPLILMGKRTS
ncbi:hypothetical protein OXX79_001028 [Metschnikowia pulcherrima]